MVDALKKIENGTMGSHLDGRLWICLDPIVCEDFTERSLVYEEQGYEIYLPMFAPRVGFRFTDAH